MQFLLLGRNRNDMRKTINGAMAFREASSESGKIGRVTWPVLGIQTEHFLMTYTRSSDGSALSDKTQIHNLVSAHFKDRFGISAYVD